MASLELEHTYRVASTTQVPPLATLSGPNAIPQAGLFQIPAFVDFLELFVMKDATAGEFVGDFRNDFIDFGWDCFDEETLLQKHAI